MSLTYIDEVILCCCFLFLRLDIGDGKEVNLPSCPRVDLQRQCIKYLGPVSEVSLKNAISCHVPCLILVFACFCLPTRKIEREVYEVIVLEGKLVYKKSGVFLNTNEDSKWIFVLSTSRSLYVAQKKKGRFQHSSFLSGGVTTSAGRLVVHEGVLEVRE